MPWIINQPAPCNVGEPQSVRDAWDKHLRKEAEADALIKEAFSEIEID